MSETSSVEISDFIRIEGCKNPQPLSTKNLEFWNYNPPDQVVFATGSIRKAIMLICQINNFSFDVIKNGKLISITNPLELLGYFNENVYNGNGSVKKKTFLGYLFGVELYIHPGDGESDSNVSPADEAKKKALFLYQDPELGYQGQNILIFGSDTVDLPSSAEEPMGKPENEKGNNHPFPQSQDFDNDADYQSAIRLYLEEWKMRFYTFSEVIIHTNAIAILDSLTGVFMDLEDKANLILTLFVDSQKMKNAIPYQDMAGGGIFQQLIDWGDIDAIKAYFDDASYKLIENQSNEIIAMALMCQIMGCPHAIIELLRIANIMRNTKEEV
ncbi:MAG: hypothetical protein H6772_04210 [Pseudomonadales bacterium]|nr:hypothetical protein [Pseudomonadales bacterium]